MDDADAPLTRMICPVMNEVLGEDTNRIASAISRGSPARPSGTLLRKAALFYSVPVKRSSIAV
jgi:hypothetical protein